MYKERELLKTTSKWIVGYFRLAFSSSCLDRKQIVNPD